MEGELKKIYYNAFVWDRYVRGKKKNPSGESCSALLADSLQEQLFRVSEWALDTLALLEPRGMIALGRKDFDLGEQAQRLDMLEIVEGFGSSRLKPLIKPILEFNSWNQVAKNGRNIFSFQPMQSVDVRYFLHSENKWICLCALFCLSNLPDIQLEPADRDRIKALTRSSYPWMADAASILLKENNPQGEVMMDPFKLLEAVLFLKKTQLFYNVSAEKLMTLAEISNPVMYKKGSLISKENDISDQLYIVKTGSLKITKLKNGVKTILSIIRSGETYGEIGLFTQSPRSATAFANEDSEVYVIQRSALKKILLDIPEIAFNFLEIFSEKLRKNSEELSLLHTILTGKNKREAEIGTSRQ
jgi:hypothetical protein